MTRHIFLGLVTAAALFAQTAPAPSAPEPEYRFEVASIHPMGPLVPNQNTQVSGGVHISGTQFRASLLSLADYLAIGYGVRQHQLEAPDWARTTRFEINATMPPPPAGGKFSEDGKELSQMMRALLEERFAVKSHKIQKDFAIYALVQTKDGIQAKENALDPDTGEGVTVGTTAGNGGSISNLGRGASLSIAAGKIEGKKLQMLVLAEILGQFMDRPVVNETGLTSAYDISIELAPQDFQAMMIRAATKQGVTLPPQALQLLDTATLDTLHDALDRAGLKLEARKAPLDVIVIDEMNQTPTEN